MRTAPPLPSERLDRSRYELVDDERFGGPALDTSRWWPHYLSQWSTPERSAARYALGPEGLTLRIDHHQPAWGTEYDGELRVSNLQTGVRSGPVGSSAGQHPFRAGLMVRTAQPERRLWLPKHALIEVRLRPGVHPRALTFLWLIGFEHVPEQSPDYPLQLMLNLYELPNGSPRDPADYPLEGGVQWMREWRRR